MLKITRIDIKVRGFQSKQETVQMLTFNSDIGKQVVYALPVRMHAKCRKQELGFSLRFLGNL